MASCCIYRHFAKVTETENFSQFDFVFLNKILSSSELSVSSELEIFQAANLWLDCGDRRMFATDLLLKVRFSLLPDPLLRNLSMTSFGLSNFPSFYKNEDSRLLLYRMLRNKEEFYSNKSSCFYSERRSSNIIHNIKFYTGDRPWDRYLEEYCHIFLIIFLFFFGLPAASYIIRFF